MNFMNLDFVKLFSFCVRVLLVFFFFWRLHIGGPLGVPPPLQSVWLTVWYLFYIFSVNVRLLYILNGQRAFASYLIKSMCVSLLCTYIMEYSPQFS